MDDFSALWTLAAVGFGFLLGEGGRWVRYRCQIRLAKKQIEEELKSIRKQIPLKRDIVQKMIRSMQKNELLPGTSVPIISLAYEHNVTSVLPHLTESQRNSLHVIYEISRILDDQMERFHTDFSEAVRSGLFKNIWETGIQQLQEIDEQFEKIQSLVDSYLSGEPVDVFFQSR